MPKLLLVAAATLVVVSGVASATTQSDGAFKIQPLPSPAKSPAGQPQLSVSTRGVLLSWVERTGTRATLKFAERTSAGWSAARVIAAGDDWFVNWADVPSVIRLSNGTRVAHWLQKSGPGTYAYDVRLSRSSNDGNTWSASTTPHHDGTKTEHVFASLCALPASGLGLVWLDGREMKPDMAAGGGAMTLRYGAFDRTGKQSAETAIDVRVCECCPTAAAMTADGPIVAYRNRTEQEIRDIYVSRLEGGTWSEPRPVANDGWNITGCPVNGPALAARGKNVVVAWFTGKENQNRAFVAFSQDAGRTFGSPIRLDDTATLGRVDVELLDDGSAVASWIEHAASVTEFRLRRVQPSGVRTAATTIAPMTTARTSGYPRLARHGDELVMAWVDAPANSGPARANDTSIKTAVVQLPRSGR